MTIPTNRPNPERPSVPMFPERDGIHMFHEEGREEKMVGIFWNALHQAWQHGKYDCTLGEFLEDVLRDWKYYGPVLTPTQLTELLAGERKRCAQVCSAVMSQAHLDVLECGHGKEGHEIYLREKGIYSGADECRKAISNLGDAP